VQVGDILRVRPGDKVPTDGLLIAGSGQVDESLISGEPLPVAKQPGDAVVGGTLNTAGSFTLQVTAIGADTVLAGIVRLVDHAQGSKLPVQKLADRISARFVPAVGAISAATLLGWLAAGQPLSRALSHAVAVLLIACPCALGLATPTAIMVGMGEAARRGIYLRNGEALETAATLDTLVFDKTGTITAGHPVVTDFLPAAGSDARRLLAQIAGVEQHSEHYLARAIMAYCRAQAVSPEPAGEFSSTPGQGSCFVVTLPFALAAAEAHAKAAAASPLPVFAGHPHVLVVEDNATNQQVVTRMLDKLGLRASLAADGKEAIAMLARLPHDLVLMDCQMPVMDGFETTRRLRAGAAGAGNAALPVIAMTANAMAGDREKCFAAGMNDFLAKPVALDELAAKLAQWLPVVQAPPAAASPAAPAASATADQAAFDAPSLLAQLGGDHALAREIVAIGLQDLPAHLDAFGQALRAHDTALACREAHTLKGLARQLGGPALAALCQRLESGLRQGSLPDAAELAALRSHLARLTAALEAWLKR
ncbi:MAG: HAD-IC family P-type ATPase, partial [Rhodocyclaceae bacterium]|nr:HAD-IC family P-type ATPase [Rhodocyclaceae bacterium]